MPEMTDTAAATGVATTHVEQVWYGRFLVGVNVACWLAVLWTAALIGYGLP